MTLSPSSVTLVPGGGTVDVLIQPNADALCGDYIDYNWAEITPGGSGSIYYSKQWPYISGLGASSVALFGAVSITVTIQNVLYPSFQSTATLEINIMQNCTVEAITSIEPMSDLRVEIDPAVTTVYSIPVPEYSVTPVCTGDPGLTLTLVQTNQQPLPPFIAINATDITFSANNPLDAGTYSFQIVAYHPGTNLTNSDINF